MIEEYKNHSVIKNFIDRIGDKFVPDGIVNEYVYHNTEPKIVFVLKETNDQETNLTDLLNEPFTGKYHYKNETYKEGNLRITSNLRKTWLNIARWTYGIMSLKRTNELVKWKEIEANSDWYNNVRDGQNKSGWLKELEKVSIVNIKKTSGKSSANNEELIQAVKDYGDLTFEQIKSYKPNIVVFCGVSSIFDTYYLKKKQPTVSWEKTKMGYWYFKNKEGTINIQFWHPNAHFPNNMMFYALIDIVKEIQEKT